MKNPLSAPSATCLECGRGGIAIPGYLPTWQAISLHLPFFSLPLFSFFLSRSDGGLPGVYGDLSLVTIRWT